jgi:enamine deaminase RidA (YjgF/YER057c/UK114 family)
VSGDAVLPVGWMPAKGYTNGVACGPGRTVYVGGQIGWDGQQRAVSSEFVAQFDQALANVVAVVEAAGGQAADVVKMTVFVTDIDAYRSNLRAIGGCWRARLGKHFPAMALVAVTALVEPWARVEIEAIAHVGEKG